MTVVPLVRRPVDPVTRGDDVFHADPLAMGRLAITGAVSNPRARSIDVPRRIRGAQRGALLLALCAIAWGLVYMGVWAIACLWRWAEPMLTVLAVGAAMAVIAFGIGVPG